MYFFPVYGSAAASRFNARPTLPGSTFLMLALCIKSGTTSLSKEQVRDECSYFYYSRPSNFTTKCNIIHLSPGSRYLQIYCSSNLNDLTKRQNLTYLLRIVVTPILIEGFVFRSKSVSSFEKRLHGQSLRSKFFKKMGVG